MNFSVRPLDKQALESVTDIFVFPVKLKTLECPVNNMIIQWTLKNDKYQGGWNDVI